MEGRRGGTRDGRTSPRYKSLTRTVSRPGRAVRFAIPIVVLVVANLGWIAADVQPAAGAGQACNFATPGTGTYASTLCWFDLSAYDAAQATSASGQQLTVDLPGGDAISFTLKVSGSAVKAAAFPTYGGAFLGNGGYTGVAGDPALYQTASGTTTATLSAISVTDSGGAPLTAYSLVGADAESTDPGESIVWTSSTPLSSLTATPSGNGIGNACGGGFSGVGTTTVTCIGSATGNKTGAPILAAEAPSTFSQQMVGTGLEGVGFGVLTSAIELNKTVVDGISGDSFKISATDASGGVVGSANTGGGTSATTGQLTVLTGASGEQFTLAETATVGSLSNYIQSWSCTRNGAADSSLPSGAAGTSATVNLDVGDFVICTITNTGYNASLSLTKHAATPIDVNHDGLTDAGDTIAYTFTVTNTGAVDIDDIAIADSIAGSVNCPQPSLAPTDSETCAADAPYVITTAEALAGAVHNTATATGTVVGSSGTVTSPPSSTTTPTTAAAPALTIKKTASPTIVQSTGQTVTYSFLITNTGNVTITDATVTDKNFTGTGTLSAINCPAGASSLAPAAQVTCHATYAATKDDLVAGRISNTATATGKDPANATVTSLPSTAHVKAELSKLGLEKTGKGVDTNHDGVIDVGDRIDWTLVVTNLGATTITNIVVSDPSAGTVTCPKTTLAPGVAMTCSAPSHRVTQADSTAGVVHNSAIASGTVGTTPVNSPHAHASVDVSATPPSVPGKLPFTGFALMLQMTAGGITASLIGAMLVTIAGIRRRTT